MKTKNVVHVRNVIRLPFFNVRNISAPEDLENDRKVYVGYTTVGSIVELPTDENVREYLLEAEGKLRRRPTQVHRAIAETLANNPENFAVLNSGVVIVSRECEIDEKAKMLVLTEPSIINGSQTQGVVRDFLAKASDRGIGEKSHVKFEVIVTNDEDLIAEISIARNFQNDVMNISIAGRRGQLEELEKSIQRTNPDAKLQKSETTLSEDYIATEKLLQIITALVPKQLWPSGKEFSKVYAYSMKAKCLKEFQELFVRAKDPKHPEHDAASALYQFFLDVAAQALELYEKWKTHQGFQGTRLRSLERDGKEITDVPDGIVFPILASLSPFAKKIGGRWSIEPPVLFNDEELIASATLVYKEMANSNPWNMGKSKSCYSSLYQVTSIYERLSRKSNLR